MSLETKTFSVRDGITSFNVHTISDRDTPPAKTIYFANGYVGSWAVNRCMAERWVRMSDGALQVVISDDPIAKDSTYRLDDYAQIFYRTVSAVSPGDSVGLALGFSRGMLSVCRAADGLASTDRVRQIGGLAPMGICPPQEFSLSWAVPRIFREAVSIPWRGFGRSGFGVFGNMSARILRHVAQNVPRAYAEIGDTFTTNVLPAVVGLSQQFPTVMIAGTHDAVVPFSQMRERLEPQGYAGKTAECNATHIGFVTDHRVAAIVTKELVGR